MTALTALLTLPPETSDPALVMKAVADQPGPRALSAGLTMTIHDKSGRKRVRKLDVRRAGFREDARTLMIFTEPVDVRGAGLLTIDPHAADAADVQWLYLPSLKRSNRIAGGRRSGAFLGSDLSYADMTRMDPEAYTFRMIDANGEVGGRAVWHLEATPKSAKTREETGYLKSEIWIDKARLTPLRFKAWLRRGKKMKYVTFKDHKAVGKGWFAQFVEARTVRGGDVLSRTALQYAELETSPTHLGATAFTREQLEKGL